NWTLLSVQNGKLVLKSTGNGITSLANAFGDNSIDFALLTIRVTLQGIPDQPRHVFCHWKGPNCSAMVKVNGNQKFQEALDTLSPNHGQLEVLKRAGFTEQNIFVKWAPGTGSHVID